MCQIGILRDLDHPNIVRMLADLKDDDQYYIVMEKVEGGELFDRIVALEAYSEEQARATAVVLLDALRYLHEKNIAHRGNETCFPTVCSFLLDFILSLINCASLPRAFRFKTRKFAARVDKHRFQCQNS
jgi:serine/threonine protein kinase